MVRAQCAKLYSVVVHQNPSTRNKSVGLGPFSQGVRPKPADRGLYAHAGMVSRICSLPFPLRSSSRDCLRVAAIDRGAPPLQDSYRDSTNPMLAFARLAPAPTADEIDSRPQVRYAGAECMFYNSAMFGPLLHGRAVLRCDRRDMHLPPHVWIVENEEENT